MHRVTQVVSARRGGKTTVAQSLAAASNPSHLVVFSHNETTLSEWSCFNAELTPFTYEAVADALVYADFLVFDDCLYPYKNIAIEVLQMVFRHPRCHAGLVAVVVTSQYMSQLAAVLRSHVTQMLFGHKIGILDQEELGFMDQKTAG